ncbi:MAG: 50S ribosomal protein L24 [Candidatus Omnitrophica bacterium]|nr:50S ribosomal protein L24 [Candidatus Omnitrophota bacterium]
MKIKKDDQVLVILGKDKGKKGRVMKVYPSESRLLVEKVNYYKKALRRSQQNPKGGIAQIEGKIAVANVQLVCPRCSKPTRVSYGILADGTKQRNCKKCHEII